MNRNKFKFHQPSLQQLQSQKLNHVFQMLKKQQDNIESLLKKYQNYHDGNQDLQKIFSKNNVNNANTDKNAQEISKKKSKSLVINKKNIIIDSNTIFLPQISNPKAVKNHSNYKNHTKPSSKQPKNTSSQTIQLQKHEQKTQLRKQLQQMYLQNKKYRANKINYQNNSQNSRLRRSRSNNKNNKNNHNNTIQISPLQKESRIMSEYSQLRIGEDENRKNRVKRDKNISILSSGTSRISHQQQQQPPRHLGVSSPAISIELSMPILSVQPYSFIPQPQQSSNKQHIPLSEYFSSFKNIISSQCIQQINYLYFSKNQSIKEWSETMLGMFEKHDKEVYKLRRNMKYLEEFDEAYFVKGVYEE